jgi:hypothetical protein
MPVHCGGLRRGVRGEIHAALVVLGGGGEAAPHVELYPFFDPLRLPKADAFPSPIILDEINSCRFDSSADSRLVRKCDRDLPINNLGSTDGRHADL